MFVPTFRYHQTEAPEGRKFTNEAEFAALGEDWVDTPAKFPAPEGLPPDGGDPTPDPALTAAAKRGLKAKETT